MVNTLYYGDNLEILRTQVPDEWVDLVYLDPPFNSNANYNVLFKEKTGEESPAQIKAFNDTWDWTQEAQKTYELEIVGNPKVPTNVKEMIIAFRQFVGSNAMMAYLVMMTPRLLELHRVLKPTGSIYLHCDPTASHYLKVLMDSVFGKENFKNEIIWRRANAHNDPKRYGRISDAILYYGKTDQTKWLTQYTPYREEYYESHFAKDESGRYFRTVPLDAPRHGEGSPALLYDWYGKLPAHTRTWAVRRELMEQYEREGRLRYTRTGTPTLMQYADEMPGVPLQNIWADIPPVNPQAKERLGYPTQKPQALLERIIQASTSEDDLVLDPFCGCGTAVAAAEKLGRRWIGIDITHLAVALMKNRLKTSFGIEPERDYQVIGEPLDVGGARALAEQDRFQFEYWALSLLEAFPRRQTGKRGADKGVDGVIHFFDQDVKKPKKAIVQVKSGKVSSGDIRDLGGTVQREKALLGLFITLNAPTRAMRTEAASSGLYHSESWKQDYPVIQIRTIGELLRGNEFEIPRQRPGMYKQAERVHRIEGRQAGLGEAGVTVPYGT